MLLVLYNSLYSKEHFYFKENNMPNTQKRVIFTCANRAWLDRARVTVRSIRKQYPDVPVFIFTNHLGFTGIKDIKDIKIDDAEIINIDVVLDNPMKGTIHEDSVCLRMKAIEYLQERGYDVGVYMDSDALLLRPFPESFWKQENGLVEDCVVKRFNNPDKKTYVNRMKEGRIRTWLYQNDFSYFNAGIVRVNMHSPEWTDILQKYQDYKEDPFIPLGPWLDQDFLNYQFRGDWEKLPVEYNIHCWMSYKYETRTNEWICTKESHQEYTDRLYSFIKEHAYVLHYAFFNKPWMKPNPKKPLLWKISMAQFWTDYAKETDYISDSLKERIKEIDAFLSQFEYNQIPIEQQEYKEIKDLNLSGNEKGLTEFFLKRC